MKKIYTIRNLNQQQDHMWNASQVEDEVAACSLRHIEGLFLKYLPKEEKILEAGCGLGAWVIHLGDCGYDIDGVDHFAEYRHTRQEVETLLTSAGFKILATTWDDFLPRKMSLGLWADFPQLHGVRLYELNPAGKLLAFALNSLSRWLLSGGIFFLARKK